MSFEPSPSTSSLVKLTLFVHRKANMSVSDFEHYWTNIHPRALGEFNDKMGKPIRRYVQCHRNPKMPTEGAKVMGTEIFGKENQLNTGFEAVVEVWFDSVEDMRRTYASPLYKEIVSPDEARFGAGPMQFVVQQEVVQWDFT